jgi:hypothetical protein
LHLHTVRVDRRDFRIQANIDAKFLELLGRPLAQDFRHGLQLQ